jgi:choline-sulfatase
VTARRLAALALPALLLVAAACRGRGKATFPQASVLLVSVDTLRADHLPAYGYAKGATPHLDALAREGVVFEDVLSHCPLTLPAHASLFTGLLPPRHGVRDNAGFTLAAGQRPLAVRFREKGLATGGAVSSYVLRRATGVAEGFDLFDDAVTQKGGASLGEQQRDGALAVEAVASWVEGLGGRRFFAFVHLYEPHAPYTPPAAYRGLPSAYDGEIAYADELVGRLLDRLKSAGRLEDTVVAVTSDHGEGLGDHGEKEHGFFVYREALHVPLLLRLPGRRRAGTRVKGVVAQVDVPATLLDLAGLDASGLDGVSQRAALQSGRAAARSVYAESLFPLYHFGWSALYAASDDRLLFIDAPRPELYDVRADPGQKANLAAERGPTVAAMRAFVDAHAQGRGAPAPAPVAADVRERLEALGYVGSAPAAPPPSGTRADPKDMIASYEAYRDATGLAQRGHHAEAVPALQRVLAASPGMRDAREALGISLFRLGRAAEAVAALEAVVKEDPQRASAHLLLARIHGLAGRRAAAEKHAAAAAAGDPGRAFEALAETLFGAGRTPDAVAFARRAVAADPDRVAAHYVLGLAAQRQGNCTDALLSFERAAAARARQPGLIVPGLDVRRGDCLARLGRDQEAEQAFRAELAAEPRSAEGRIGLAILYRAQGREQEARAALEGLIEPGSGAGDYWTVVRTLAGLGDLPAARQWAAQARARFPDDPRFQTNPPTRR